MELLPFGVMTPDRCGAPLIREGQVVAGIDAGPDWKAFGGGQYAVIHKVTCCKAAGRYLSPYFIAVHLSFGAGRPGQQIERERQCGYFVMRPLERKVCIWFCRCAGELGVITKD